VHRKKEWAYAAALTNWMPITSGGSASSNLAGIACPGASLLGVGAALLCHPHFVFYTLLS
jgi:hypothetical protein